MVIANGCPKSGTHALMEWLQRMGLKRAPGIVKAEPGRSTLRVYGTPADPEPVTAAEVLEGRPGWFIHGHLQPVKDVGDATVITVVRDPRNVLVSYVRWWNSLNEKQTTLLETLGAFFDDSDYPFLDIYRDFLGWAGRGPIMRYEHMPRVKLPGVYNGASANHSTWNDEPSDWRSAWSDDIEREWLRRGGARALIEAGYLA